MPGPASDESARELTVLPDGRRIIVEAYRPRLRLPAVFGLEFGEWLDWARARGGWLVSVRTADLRGRVVWWRRATSRGDALLGVRQVASGIREGEWPPADEPS